MSRVVTLADVAAHARVSLATASRVINGSARQVGSELQERVLASSRELGYVVDAQAQAMAKGANRTVALVVGDIADPYFASIAAGVIAAAERRGLAVTIIATGSDAAKERDAVAALRSQRPQAILLAGSRQVDRASERLLDAELDLYEQRGGRVAFVGDGGQATRTDRVVRVQNRQGAFELARALVGIGYTRFVVLGGPAHLVTAEARVEGFLDGLASSGVAAGSVPVIHGALTRDGGFAGISAALDDGAPFECVFAVADVMAVGAMTALSERGLRPGADVGIAGFDDIPMLQDVRPGLTTVALPLVEIGATALEFVLSDGPQNTAAEIDGVVRLRDSTPPIRASAPAAN